MRLHGGIVPGLGVALLPLLAASGSCADELPPLPEAVIVVDTDALVPQLVDRLRVDFYDGDGVWVDSRDLPRRFARDWPASFSVYGQSETESRTILIRLRAYSDGHVRDYRGERFMARPLASDPSEIVEWPAPPTDEAPRLLSGGRDVTPDSEPAPNLAIDRLIRVELTAGVRNRHEVVLRGVCFGTMVDLANRTSCIDTENERVEVEPELPVASQVVPPASQVNQFGAAQGCTREPRGATTAADGTPLHDEEVCVPGGAFILGDGAVSGILNFALPTVPERVAVMSPLLVDRYEVTVARWREARDLGFDHPYEPDGNNADEPLPTGGPLAYPLFCVYSQDPLEEHSRESYPLNCLTWEDARAFCQFNDSDLLTEAAWELVSSATGEGAKTIYPWGNDAPTCESQVYGRPVFGAVGGYCSEYAFGPAEAGAGPGDVTPLGIRDLGGSMSEWLLDSPRPFDSNCWAAQGLADPLCWEDDVEHRSSRGGAWAVGPGEMLSAVRPAPSIASRLFLHMGFRCARTGVAP